MPRLNKASRSPSRSELAFLRISAESFPPRVSLGYSVDFRLRRAIAFFQQQISRLLSGPCAQGRAITIPGKDQNLLELVNRRAFGNGLGNPSANQGADFIGRFALLGEGVGFLDRDRQFAFQSGIVAEPLGNEPRFQSLSLLFRKRFNGSLDFSDRTHRRIIESDFLNWKERNSFSVSLITCVKSERGRSSPMMRAHSMSPLNSGNK